MRGLRSRIAIWLLAIFVLSGVEVLLINQTSKSVDGMHQNPLDESKDPADSETAYIEGFRQAKGPRILEFPRDHGPHPEYQTEWWYYTGNLESANGRHFGYQLTFFRRALIPSSLMPTRSSKWATNQVYMAHFAVTDVQTERFYNFERFSRGAVNLAGAQASPYRVWLYEWQVIQLDEDMYRLQANEGDISIDLQLTDLKGPILHGDHGFSRKGPETGNASYYISQTRLVTSGIVRIAGQEYQVNGTSWMDHEYSTSALSSDQVGWDWFSIQLDLGGEQSEQGQHLELMVFQIRRADGNIDPFSSGTLIDPQGNTVDISKEDFQIRSLEKWQSPRTGGLYPIRWQIHVRSENLVLEAEPFIKDQELNLTFDYWEGAVQVRGTWNNDRVSGVGYAELTGYAGSMVGGF